MGQPCKACNAPNRTSIDAALVSGRTLKAVSADLGINAKALGRHRANHLSPAIKAVAGEVARRDGLHRTVRDRVEGLVGKLEAMAETAEGGSPHGWLQVVDRLHRELDLLARLSGELKPDSTTVQVLNVATDPAWVERRSTILAVLAPFPEARAALAAALLADDDSATLRPRIGAGAAVAPWRPAQAPGGPEEPQDGQWREVDDG